MNKQMTNTKKIVNKLENKIEKIIRFYKKKNWRNKEALRVQQWQKIEIANRGWK